MRFHSDHKYVPTGKKAHEVCRVKVGGSRRRHLCKNHTEAGIHYAMEFSHIFFLNHFLSECLDYMIKASPLQRN